MAAPSAAAPTMLRATPIDYRRTSWGDEPVAGSGSDPLANRPITRHDVFHATVAHYAALAGVDADHLRTALRLGGVRGEPVTAAMIRDAATGLARAGYLVPPPAPPPPDPAVVADLADIRRYRSKKANPSP